MHFLDPEQMHVALENRGLTSQSFKQLFETDLVLPKWRAVNWVADDASSYIAAKHIVDGVGHFTSILLAFYSAGRFLSLEDRNLIERLYLSFGERRALYQAPGIVFETHDVFHLTTFLNVFLNNRILCCLVNYAPDGIAVTKSDDFYYIKLRS